MAENKRKTFQSAKIVVCRFGGGGTPLSLSLPSLLIESSMIPLTNAFNDGYNMTPSSAKDHRLIASSFRSFITINQYHGHPARPPPPLTRPSRPTAANPPPAL